MNLTKNPVFCRGCPVRQFLGGGPASLHGPAQCVQADCPDGTGTGFFTVCPEQARRKAHPAGQLLYDRLKDLPDELEQLLTRRGSCSCREEARLNIGILRGRRSARYC